MLRYLHIFIAILLIPITSGAHSLYDIDIPVMGIRQDTLKESKIIPDKAIHIAQPQTGHKRLDKIDFIYGNIIFSSPDIRTGPHFA